jgi:hypothetical protein
MHPAPNLIPCPAGLPGRKRFAQNTDGLLHRKKPPYFIFGDV